MTTKNSTENIERSNAYGMLQTAPKGTKIFTVVRHVSRSGMQRTIAAFLIKDGEPYFLTALASEPDTVFKPSRNHDGFKVNGTGMDMAWYTVYSIGLYVHGDGDYFTNRTI